MNIVLVITWGSMTHFCPAFFRRDIFFACIFSSTDFVCLFFVLTFLIVYFFMWMGFVVHFFVHEVFRLYIFSFYCRFFINQINKNNCFRHMGFKAIGLGKSSATLGRLGGRSLWVVFQCLGLGRSYGPRRMQVLPTECWYGYSRTPHETVLSVKDAKGSGWILNRFKVFMLSFWWNYVFTLRFTEKTA